MGMPEAYCKGCDYVLGGVAGTICPECGRPFDPACDATYSPRPNASRRRWIARARWAALILLVWLAFSPRRLERLEFSWPNPDGVTVTSLTRWEVVGPSFLPFRYPHWTSGERRGPSTSRFVEVVRQDAWDTRWIWPRGVGGFAGSVPLPGPGYRAVGLVNQTNIVPENLETLTDLLVYGIGTHGRVLISSRLVREDDAASK